MRLPPPRRAWPAAAALALAAIPIVDALSLVTAPPAQVDDAYISYRYAAHLVDGQGLVWNVGERVEGFTNPLWTLLVAAGLASGLEATAIGYGLGLAGGIALLLGTAWLARCWLGEAARALAPLAPGVLAAFGAFAFWSTAGMETALHAALAVGALVAAATRHRVAMAALLVLVTWSRMDGALLAAVLLGFDAWPRLRRLEGWTPRLVIAARDVWTPALVFAAGVALGLAARLAYYGTWLPNTYWAKVGGTPWAYGLAYVGEWLAGGAAWLVPAAALAVVRVPAARPAAVFVVLHALYVVRVGGDAFAFSRFLLVATAPLCALAVAGLGAALSMRPAVAWLVAPTLPLAATIAVFDRVPLAALALGGPIWLAWGFVRLRGVPPALGARVLAGAAALGVAAWLGLAGGPAGIAAARDEAHRNRRLAEEWKSAAYWEKVMRRRAALLTEGDPPALVATGAIGSLGYFSELPILDVLGLTDRHVARAEVDDTERGVAMPGHARSDADYVMSRRPDVIVIPRAGEGPAWVFALQDLWAHPALARDYAWDDELKAYRRRPTAAGPAASGSEPSGGAGSDPSGRTGTEPSNRTGR